MYRIGISAMLVLGVTTSFATAQPCDPSAPQTALIDLGPSTYKTFEGGLYAGGSNQRPAQHEAAGLALANDIQPTGPGQRIVLISIGISNMTHEWRVGANNDPSSSVLSFTTKANALQAAGVINPAVLIVDGAKGAMSADFWAATPPDLNTDPWLTAMNRLQFSGVDRYQVQIACIKAAHQGPISCIANDGSTLGDAGLLVSDFAAISRNLKTVFPNIKLAYYVSRSYGGYATGGNREPFAFEQGLAVKWAISAQIAASQVYGNLNYDPAAGAVVAPWMSWGPYLWANGLTPNGQGTTWAVTDFVDDHIHPSASGVDRASDIFLDFFLTDSTTRPWFGWQCMHGDADGDGTLDASDVGPFIDIHLNPTSASALEQCRADANNDGAHTHADVAAFAQLLVAPP